MSYYVFCGVHIDTPQRFVLLQQMIDSLKEVEDKPTKICLSISYDECISASHAQYKTNDPIIKVWNHSKRKSQVEHIYFIYQITQNEKFDCILFVDDDDLVSPKIARVLLYYLLNEGYDVARGKDIVTDVFNIYENINIKTFKDAMSRENCCIKTIELRGTMCIRSKLRMAFELYKQSREEKCMKCGTEDTVLFSLLTSILDVKVIYIDEPLYYYRYWNNPRTWKKYH